VAKKASKKKVSNKKKADLYDRGKVEIIDLKKSITLNQNVLTTAIIEIDHINYGLDKKTKKLNSKKRLNFTIRDIEKFIRMLDGEDLIPDRYVEKKSFYEVYIDCPVEGKFKDKMFFLIFDTDYDEPETIHTITLYPAW
jgi:hypothetical protein